MSWNLKFVSFQLFLSKDFEFLTVFFFEDLSDFLGISDTSKFFKKSFVLIMVDLIVQKIVQFSSIIAHSVPKAQPPNFPIIDLNSFIIYTTSNKSSFNSRNRISSKTPQSFKNHKLIKKYPPIAFLIICSFNEKKTIITKIFYDFVWNFLYCSSLCLLSLLLVIKFRWRIQSMNKKY